MKSFLRKTSLIACLFFSLTVQAQQFHLTQAQRLCYESILALDTSCYSILQKDNSIPGLYLQSLSETIELLMTESTIHFDKYESRFNSRIDILDKQPAADALFAKAEMQLQWTFVYLKFGHEFDAALALRQAYKTVKECKENFPQFVPIRKTSGLIQIMIGSVPDKYQWVLGLLGMEGSVNSGLRDLETVINSDLYLNAEAQLILALVQGFILQEPAKSVTSIARLLQRDPNNGLYLFFAASLAIKDSQSALAKKYLDAIESKPAAHLPLFYKNYLNGEVLLHEGKFTEASEAYAQFLREYSGQNYVKDAWFKIGMCHLLTGNSSKAQTLFDKARSAGIDNSEADKSAARALSDTRLPHIALSRLRYHTDGGYYDQANEIASNLDERSLRDQRDRTEFLYRKARLAHKTGKREALELYIQTISSQGQEPWYFAPNACLQAGYMLLERNNKQEAARYFKKALSYKRHEYKNSIDSKARSALSQIEPK